MEQLDRFRLFVEQRGRDLGELGIRGHALTFADALEAILLLRGAHVAILGGDILEEIEEELQHSYDNWISERRTGEDFEAFASRSQNEAVRFLRNYRKNPSSPRFVRLVETDEESLARLGGSPK